MSPPEVVKLLPLWRAELLADGRYGIFLSSRELKAEDGDSREDELVFAIVRQPAFGYLENLTTGERDVCRRFTRNANPSFVPAGGFVRKRFSQTELSRRTIVYIINPQAPSLNDSLDLKVSDASGNSGSAHR